MMKGAGTQGGIKAPDFMMLGILRLLSLHLPQTYLPQKLNATQRHFCETTGREASNHHYQVLKYGFFLKATMMNSASQNHGLISKWQTQ